MPGAAARRMPRQGLRGWAGRTEGEDLNLLLNLNLSVRLSEEFKFRFKCMFKYKAALIARSGGRLLLDTRDTWFEAR